MVSWMSVNDTDGDSIAETRARVAAEARARKAETENDRAMMMVLYLKSQVPHLLLLLYKEKHYKISSISCGV
jgi:hypothetical protein